MIWSYTLDTSINSGSWTWSTVPLIFNFHHLKDILAHEIHGGSSCHICWASPRCRSSSRRHRCDWYQGTSSDWGHWIAHMTSVIFQLRRVFDPRWKQFSGCFMRKFLLCMETDPELPIGYDLGTSYVALQNQIAVYSMLDFWQNQRDTKHCGWKHPILIEYLEPYFLDHQVKKIQRRRTVSPLLFGNNFGNFNWFRKYR